MRIGWELNFTKKRDHSIFLLWAANICELPMFVLQQLYNPFILRSVPVVIGKTTSSFTWLWHYKISLFFFIAHVTSNEICDKSGPGTVNMPGSVMFSPGFWWEVFLYIHGFVFCNTKVRSDALKEAYLWTNIVKKIQQQYRTLKVNSNGESS